MLLYKLILIDTELCDDAYEEAFFIGVFAARLEAEQVAEDYLHHVSGFSEYPCTFRIEEKPVKDAVSIPETVWTVTGWDENAELDEIRIVESDCFLTRTEACQNLSIMQKQHLRQHWCINKWTIGKREWTEGFCRVTRGKADT